MSDVVIGLTACGREVRRVAPPFPDALGVPAMCEYQVAFVCGGLVLASDLGVHTDDQVIACFEEAILERLAMEGGEG